LAPLDFKATKCMEALGSATHVKENKHWLL